MIQQPTLLILGAGVSVEYDFPLARELLQNVARELSGKSWLDHRMEVCGFDEALRRRFAEALHGSYQPSIDSFLQQHQQNGDYQLLGRAVIAACLIQSEEASKPALADKSTLKIYEAIWHQARATPGTYSGNGLKILTFNYDRSLERFLAGCLANSHPEFIERGVAFRQALSQFEIFHVYGDLGSLDESKKEDYLAYGGDDKPALKNTILTAATRIKFAYNVRFNDDVFFSFERLQGIIAEATVIGFLGFAFEPLNLRILKFCGVGSVAAEYYASAYKLNKGVQDAAQEALECEINFAGPNAKSVEVLGEFPILVSK